MRIEFDPDDLRRIVAEVVQQQESDRVKLNGEWLARNEADAAAALGIAKHSLRDLRLRGLVKASKLGSRIVYSKEQLPDLLAQNEID